MPCLSQSSIFNTLTILGERYKLWSSSLWSLLHSPFESLLGPNICFTILNSTEIKKGKLTGLPSACNHENYICREAVSPKYSSHIKKEKEYIYIYIYILYIKCWYLRMKISVNCKGYYSKPTMSLDISLTPSFFIAKNKL